MKDAWGLLLVVLLGQLVPFSMAVASFASSLIANLRVDAPLTQSFFAYLLLTLAYVPILLCRRQKLRIPWFWYLALSLIDVQGNYLVVKAYQYSYITSVTLLDCWTVLWVILLTWYALGTRYSFWQFLGAGTCVAGLSLVLLSDVKSPDEQDPRKIPLLGMPLLLPGQFVMHLARLVRLVMHCISCCYQQYFLKFLECTIFLEYVGIWCQDNRSNRSCRNAWTIWITC